MVNTMKTGQAFCQAVGSIIGKSIDEANFNTTRKGIITAVLEQATGKYQVRHQDADWIAYAPAEIKYSVDTEVSLVNTNNNTEEFYILGSINPSATEYTEIPSPNNSYDLIGMSLVNGQISLTSYLDKVYILYKSKDEDENENEQENEDEDEQEDENTLVLNPSAMDAIRTSNGILLSANFQTNFSPGQYGGRYGLIFNLVFNDENEVDGFVTKTVALDFSNVIGNPYGLTRPTKVENLFIQVDPAKFHHIDSILAFTEGFNIIKNESDIVTPTDYDIRITNIKLNGANPLTQEQLTSYKMHINYSANGNKIDEDNLELKLVAQLKAKGVIINENVAYYWFRQNATIFRGSSKYCPFGGEGWQCLNYYNGKNVSALTTNEFYVLSGQESNPNRLNSATINNKQTVLKCVGVYNKSNWIEGTVKIINDNVTEDIKIVSSDLLANGQNKNKYYLDAGNPTLTCVIDDNTLEKYPKDLYKYRYTWTQAEKGQQAKVIEQVESTDEQYREVLKEQLKVINGVLNKISNNKNKEEYLKQKNLIIKEPKELTNQQVLDQADKLVTKGSYAYQDVYHNYPIGRIINYKVISCGVEVVKISTQEEQEGAEPVYIYIGTASTTIYNIHELANTYSLNIANGTQVFQYDDKGNSPCSKSLEKPLQIPTLTFTLIDSEGGQVSHDLIRQNGVIRWSVPKENTLLLNPNGDDKATTADDDNNYVIENSSTLSYSIANQYDRNKKDNNIQLYLELQVNGQKIKIIGYTNLTFAKDGDPGTNGTDYVAKISPSEATDRIYISTQDPDRMFDDNGNTVDNLEFQLYNNSIKVNLDSVDNINYFKSLNKVENIYYNIYNTDTENKQTVKLTSSVDNRMLDHPHPVNILRGVYQLGDLKYYAQYPIIINYIKPVTDETKKFQYRFKIRPKTGFKYVQYAEDGTSPNYDNRQPFEIIVEKYIQTDTDDEKAGYFIQQDSGIYYKWFVVGNLKEITSTNSSTFSIEPKDTFDGSDLTSAIYVKIYDWQKIQFETDDGFNGSSDQPTEDNCIGYIYIPIYMYLNRYNNRALNDWDGNSIDLGEENGVILAPQIGAGQKEDDGTNTFTGVVMGRQLNSNNEEQVGLFGYEHGQRSIFLDSKTGNATFGKQGAGQIKIDARTNEGTIQSGDYAQYVKTEDTAIDSSKTYYILKDGKYEEVSNPVATDLNKYYEFIGLGMKIKFSSTGTGDEQGPYIKFGSQDFSVTHDGHIHAKGGGDIAGWNISDDALTSPNGKLKLGNTNINFKDSNNNTVFDVTVNDSGSSASIAGWSFDEYKFSKNNAGINSVTSTGTNNGSKTVDGKAVAFYAGDTKFYVTHDGYLKSVDGKIANWNITLDDLNDGRTHLGDATFPSSHSKNSFGQGMTARIWSFASSQSDPNEGLNFVLSNDGKIYSKAGKIGGWNISGNQLSANNIHLDSNGNMRSNNYTNTSQSKTGWSVSGNGNAYFNQIETNGMTANNIDVNSGNIDDIDATNIRATSGKIGKVTIDENGLTGDNWWVRSDNAHFKGLIVDTNDIKSSSDGGIKSSGYSGSGGSGWSMPSGSGKPSWNYDGYSMNPITVKTVGVLSLSKVHPQDSGNYYIPSGLQDLTVVTSVNFDAKTVTTTSIKDITGYAVRDWIVQGWGNSTTLPQYEVMAANNYTGASTAENT